MHTTESFIQLIKEGLIAEVRAALEEDPSLANLNEPNGPSAVLTAAYYQQPEIARLLVRHGARLDLYEACAVGELDRVRSLLKADPGLVNQFASDGFQPLGLACFFGHTDLVRFLIESGAELNSPSLNPLQVMPLHSAAAGSWVEIVRMLVTHGASVNARQADDFTPLHSAAQNGSLEIIQILVDAGAEVNARDSEGKTPLSFAIAEGHEAAVDFLRGYGAVV